MKKWILAILGFVMLTVLVGGCSIATGTAGAYNRIIGEQAQAAKSWGDVESTYQRRADLIGNLVETVKGSANFEKEVLIGVSQARASATQMKVSLPPGGTPSASQIQDFAQAQQGLGTALSRLLVASEKYPDLKASEAFANLQSQIEGTENRITVARQAYNNSVATYNTSIQKFPFGLLASFVHSFPPRAMFEADKSAATAPKVKF